MEHVTDESFRSYLTFLYETGCRPEEIRKIRRDHVQDTQVVLPPSAGKGGFGRNILLSKTAADLLETLPKTGWLFVNSKGGVWDKSSVNSRMRRLRKKTGIEGLVATSWRHGFATQASEAWRRSHHRERPHGPQRYVLRW
jgi:integrase